ncbi:MAG: putative transporter [Ignavibacteria bacterium]|jgi:putative transport protein|nr:putative transporter [Ignavibacteria bacterium]MCU7502955.1 putative transporter [Ignavibacteria bacterium]MCU7517062.1 putative transporter [Ignavibacteria bacterium]
MSFLYTLFTTQTTASTLLYLCLAAFSGVIIGKVEIKNIKLGIAGVLFSGLLIAHLGARADAAVIGFARDFGLILFVYSIGLDIGPRFFSTFKNEGLKLNLFAVSIVLLNLAITFVLYKVYGLQPSLATGIMCGAVTNTPGLGSAQQVLHEFSKTGAEAANLAGMGYAVAYPFGVMGIILTMILVRIFFKVKVKEEAENYTKNLANSTTKLESVSICVTNPQLFGKKIGYIKTIIDKELVISRIKRGEQYFIAVDDEEIKEGDVLYGVSTENHIENLGLKIGEVKIQEKREIRGDLSMAQVLVTNRKYSGKTIQQIGIYRRYEANITRIFRAGMEILPSLDTTVEFGDTVRIVGKTDLLPEIRSELGNSMKELSVPNTVPVFIGIFLGVILGSIPVFIPGLPAPAKLGLAGGPLIIAILLGHKGRVGRMDFYMTPGANMMLREVGIILFLASVGLLSGANFISTIWNGGYWWMLYGAAITFIPIMIVSIVARLMKFNYLKICGLISGTMTDPPALEFANSLAPVQAQSTAYATVYPLAMFLRVLVAQMFILLTL